MDGNDLIQTRRRRGTTNLRTTFDVPDDIEEKPAVNDDVISRRRHTTIHKPGLDRVGLLPVTNQTGRRFSMMPPMEAARRLSVGITDAQRAKLHLPRYSKVFGFATFTGLPMMDYCDPVIGYENTYRMEPDNRFDTRKVKQVVEKIIDDLLYWDDDVLIDENEKPENAKDSEKYEAQKHKRREELIKKMVEEVKDELKELDYSRYKYVVNAMIGEVKGQGMRVASRCLWDSTKDRFVCVEKKGRDGYVVVIVHAVYFE